ncbi:hypothetical protein [Sphingomicrobium flavum]|uniref:hypothetical protein n=1 Tax=Sphingomicrobium flavum TaxID=1229164 RepID=UPI0021AD6EBD|nr:hypothetical protein [Sphingomicrobium flavum]
MRNRFRVRRNEGLIKRNKYLAELIAAFGKPSWSISDEDSTESLNHRAVAAQIRSRNRKGSGPNFRARDSHARHVSRRYLKSHRSRPIRFLPKHILAARFRANPLLDALAPERKNCWIPVINRPAFDGTPSLDLSDFDMIDQPEQTMKHLSTIAKLEAVAPFTQLNFNDHYCEDAGAYLLLAELWPQMARIFIGGRMDYPVQKVLDAVGLGHQMNIRLGGMKPSDESCSQAYEDVWEFRLQRRLAATAGTSQTRHLDPQQREKAADRFVQTVNKWLSVADPGKELTPLGKGWIGSLMGEVLDNAERHSQPKSDDGDWSTAGFMVRREGKLKCHLAFLSVGRTFADSFKEAAPEVRKKLSDYSERHPTVSRETLSTLFALQDTITCDHRATDVRSGGTGLQDVMEFVKVLGATADGSESADSKMTIVSGNACIRLRTPYLAGKRRDEHGPRGPRLLWCNAANDWNFPPDEAFVSTLSEKLAGSLVSVSFTIDPEYIKLLGAPSE